MATVDYHGIHFSGQKQFDIIWRNADVTVRCLDFEYRTWMFHELTSHGFHELLLFLFPRFLELNALSDYLCESFRILAYVFEADAKVFENIKVIAGTEETSGFAIEQNSSDVGIVSEYLSEGGFPFVTVTVSLKPDAVVGLFANGFGVFVEGCLTVVGVFARQKVKRKAERECSVIVIDDIERSVFSVEVFDTWL